MRFLAHLDGHMFENIHACAVLVCLLKDKVGRSGCAWPRTHFNADISLTI